MSHIFGFLPCCHGCGVCDYGLFDYVAVGSIGGPSVGVGTVADHVAVQVLHGFRVQVIGSLYLVVIHITYTVMMVFKDSQKFKRGG